MSKQRELDRQWEVKKLRRADPECDARWAPGTCGFHEVCDRAMVMLAQINDLLVDHPAVLLDPELYDLAIKAEEAMFRFEQAASIKCVQGEKARKTSLDSSPENFLTNAPTPAGENVEIDEARVARAKAAAMQMYIATLEQEKDECGSSSG